MEPTAEESRHHQSVEEKDLPDAKSEQVSTIIEKNEDSIEPLPIKMVTEIVPVSEEICPSIKIDAARVQTEEILQTQQTIVSVTEIYNENQPLICVIQNTSSASLQDGTVITMFDVSELPPGESIL